VERLVGLGYPELAGLSEDRFRAALAPLQERLPELDEAESRARIAFVVALAPGVVPRERALPLVVLDGRPGFTDVEADDLARFAPIEGLELPAGLAYLVADLDTGRSTLDVTPDDALEAIAGEGRSPLTIEEGVALATHHPTVLRTMNCFSMLGSRCGDRRVTALWISKGRPRLGWCWAGNPHTWLGSASCGARLGAG
jgi:hypothetical protein